MIYLSSGKDGSQGYDDIKLIFPGCCLKEKSLFLLARAAGCSRTGCTPRRRSFETAVFTSDSKGRD